MKCTLMNKNVPVADLELDADTAAIIKVITSYNLACLPVGVGIRKGIPDKKELNDWWYGRAIPASRSGIRSALEKMDMNQPEQLLTKCQNSSYQHFLQACSQLGIPSMKEFLDYILVFDYIMANTDRHFGNFGAIRNVNTLEWVGPAPVFDSGTSLWHDKLTKNIHGYDTIEGKPFYADAERQMKLVSDYSWIPFEQLEGVEDDIRSVFASSEFMEEERIEAIVQAVKVRIEKLKAFSLSSSL